jgi:PBP1b-binding outer membrane lipoprotein LpoB
MKLITKIIFVSVLFLGCNENSQTKSADDNLKDMSETRDLIAVVNPDLKSEPDKGAANGPEEPSRVWIEPGDLVTATSFSDVKIGYESMDSISDEKLSLINEKFTLLTWPEKLPVSTSFSIDTFVKSENQYINTRFSSLRGALGERWYAVKVAKDVKEEELYSGFYLDEDGFRYIRFKTAPGPLVRSISFCQKPGKMKVMIDYSERIKLGSQPIEISGPGSDTCSRVATRIDNKGVEEFDDTESISSLICDSLDLNSDSIAISIPGDITSNTDTTVLIDRDESIKINHLDLAENHQGCLTYRVPNEARF